MARGLKFYFKNGRWHVTSESRVVPAREWWNAINQVKCLNHQLCMKEQSK